jgi:hypothetical protein
MRLSCKNCQNVRNRVMTSLPVPSQPETEPWPTQWKAYIACVRCGTVALYVPRDIETSKAIQPSLSNSADVSIMFDCLESQCGSVVQFYMRLPGSFDMPTLRDLLRPASFMENATAGMRIARMAKNRYFVTERLRSKAG